MIGELIDSALAFVRRYRATASSVCTLAAVAMFAAAYQTCQGG